MRSLCVPLPAAKASNADLLEAKRTADPDFRRALERYQFRVLQT